MKGLSNSFAIAFCLCFLTVAWKQALPQELSASPRALSRTAATRPSEFEISPFYDIEQPLPSGKPGDLIRSEVFERYELPFNVIAVRMLYRSRAATGADVATSGVILYPDGNAPRGGWPVIAWAHPVIGTARACAPSLTKSLRDGPLLSMYVNMGFAVVATDYAGLGTPFRNAFIDMPSNATDVIYSIAAARRAVPGLSARWIVIGEDDGGAAAIMTAELESQRGDPDFLGSIAISGALDLRMELEPVDNQWHDSLASLAYGIQSVYPQFHLNDMLTGKAMASYEEVTRNCSAETPSGHPPSKEMLQPKWQNNPFVQKFIDRNTLGHQPARSPLLLIDGDDHNLSTTMSASVEQRLCQLGDHIDTEKYTGVDSGHLVGESVSAQISWIKARFSGRSVPGNCPH